MQKETEILKGTTTVGVVCRNGVILGTDTRATMGNYVASKRAKKVYQITDNLAMTIAGGVAVAQRVVEILKINSRLYELEKNRSIPVKPITCSAVPSSANGAPVSTPATLPPISTPIPPRA